MKRTVYALLEHERLGYHLSIDTRRRAALNYFEEFFADHDPEDWLAQHACLCEFFQLLFQFENALEAGTLAGLWDDAKRCWFLPEDIGLEVILYTKALALCSDDLLGHNISFSLH
jgi:hypothetical protein